MKTKQFTYLKLAALVVLKTIAAALVIFLIAIWIIQPKIFFHPWHDAADYEKLLENVEFEQVIIDRGNGKLLGWLKINTTVEEAPLLIFFDGNAQNSSNTCIDFLDKNIYPYFENYNFLVVDYPGYGLSDGVPSDKSMFQAALSIYDYACELKCVDKNQIVVMGYSIGTGSATYVASQRNVNGLILISPYDCALSLYNEQLNIFHGPLKLLARYKFDSLSYAPNVQVKPLIVTSREDEIINYQFSFNLAEHFPLDPEILLLENVGHCFYFDQTDVLNSIHNYLQDNLIVNN